MHAWDCACGTRNAAQLAACHRCGRPMNEGRPVQLQTQAPPAPQAPPAWSQSPSAPPPAPAPQPPLAHPTYGGAYGPPAPYSTPYGAPQPFPAAPQSVVDACAILSTVFGALGLFSMCCVGWAFGLVGAILGVVSLVRLGSNPLLHGKGLAWTGLILSLIPVLFTLFWLALALLSAAAS
jgi:hypothetical protein